MGLQLMRYTRLGVPPPDESTDVVPPQSSTTAL